MNAKTFLLTLALVLVFSLSMIANPTTAQPTPDLTINAEVEAENITGTDFLEKLATGFTNIFDTIINAITSIIMIPVNAFATITGNWAGTLGSWWAPILAVAVIIGVLFLIRLYVMFDSGLDTLGDWISGDK